MSVAELIRDAMDQLEQMPMGGVGIEGPTLDELTTAAEQGHVIGDDASYHCAQAAWRFLEQAMAEVTP